MKEKEEFISKRRANPLGFYTRAQLAKKSLEPHETAEPTVVGRSRELYYRKEDCRELISKSRARKEGLTLKKGAEPKGSVFYQKYQKRYMVYSRSDFRRIQKRKERPAVRIALLEALFQVNRSAKRYRDASRKCYSRKLHGFARSMADKKEELYSLKDAALKLALEQGLVAFHGFRSQLAEYRGGGYCFHAPWIPFGIKAPEGLASQEALFVSAKPRANTDSRLKDAIHSIQVALEENEIKGKYAQISDKTPLYNTRRIR